MQGINCPIVWIQSVCYKWDGLQSCIAEMLLLPSHSRAERSAEAEVGVFGEFRIQTLYCLHCWRLHDSLNPLDIHSCYRSKLPTSPHAHPENHLFKKGCEDKPLTQATYNSSKSLCVSHILPLQKHLLCSCLREYKRNMT